MRTGMLSLIPPISAVLWGIVGYFAVLASFELNIDQSMPVEKRREQVDTRYEKIEKKGTVAWMWAGGLAGVVLMIFVKSRPPSEFFEVVAQVDVPVTRAQRSAYAVGIGVGIALGLILALWYFPGLDTTETSASFAPVRSLLVCLLLAVSAGLLTSDLSTRFMKRLYGRGAT